VTVGTGELLGGERSKAFLGRKGMEENIRIGSLRGLFLLNVCGSPYRERQ